MIGLGVEALRDVQTVAESIARAAGAVLLAGAQEVRDDVTTKASVMDVVTSVDVAVEKLIVAQIVKAFPDDAILGEEGASRAGTTGRRWVIDPIDGTSNFVRGWKASVVSIGVEVDNDFVVGVVYDPFRDELFSAATGLGALRNGQRLPRRAASPPLAEAFVGLIGGYMTWARAERAVVASRLLISAGELRYTGSMALDLCYAARSVRRVLWEWLLSVGCGGRRGDRTGSRVYCQRIPRAFHIDW